MGEEPQQLAVVYSVSSTYKIVPGQTVFAISDQNGAAVTFGTKTMRVPPSVILESEVTITMSLEEIDQLVEILKDQRAKILDRREQLKDASKIQHLRPAKPKAQSHGESAAYQ